MNSSTEANQLAADILMPLSSIRAKYDEGLKTCKQLAKAFNVSEAAMRIRVMPLQLKIEET